MQLLLKILMVHPEAIGRGVKIYLKFFKTTIWYVVYFFILLKKDYFCKKKKHGHTTPIR